MKTRCSFVSNSSSSSYIIILTKKDYKKTGLTLNDKLFENVKLGNTNVVLVSHISGNDSYEPDLSEEFYDALSKIRELKEKNEIDAIIRSESW